jgi:putative nucleotidyltransferase with HDIG domain
MTKSVFTLADGERVNTETDEEREKKRYESETTKAFVESVKEDLLANKIYLPTLPALALEALIVINDVDSSASDLEKVISRDAALTARLIRYANSPLYRGMNTIATIRPAITRIGFQRVKNAVYAVSMKEVFRTSVKEVERRMDALWNHSVKVGAQAAMLAKGLPGMDPDVALVAGLVHDIGHIPLLIKSCKYKELINNPEFLDRVIHKLHPQLGGSILKLWKFDKNIIEAAAHHEELDRDPGDDVPVDYVDVIQVANIQSHQGTEHFLASVDHSKIKSFSRLNPGANGDLDADTKKVEDAIF